MDGELAGVLFALIFWGFVLGCVLAPLIFKYRERKQVHETVRAMIASGSMPSDELLKALQAPQDAAMPVGEKATATGIIVVSVGLGAMAFGGILFAVLTSNGIDGGRIAGPIVAGAGLIVALIGGAYILIGRRSAGRSAQNI